MTTIPLNRLIPAKTNVRRHGGADGIEELAASIASHGLLTSLTVRKAARGKFTVIAGQRRYHALSMLAARDQVPADLPVLCQVLDADADATEIGLAENVVRLAMHPADQFEAFRALVDKGADAADIATRFGVSEATVARRLKLGRVSPAILDAYRAGELSLEQVQAFAVSDDHEAQERVRAGLAGYRASPRAIREALTEGEIPATDKRVRFVGLEAYEAAGGSVRRDLFDEEDGGYARDAALLDRLVQQKLAEIAETVRAEGWKWVEAHADFGYEARGRFRRCHPEHNPLPEAEARELEQLETEHGELMDAVDGDGEDDAAITARINVIEERFDALTALVNFWTDAAKARSGVIVSLGHDGEATVERGFIRPEDAPGDNAPDEDTEADMAADGGAEAATPSLPAMLIADLTAQNTAAIRATLARQPDVALAAVTHALATRAFYGHGGDSCLDIAVKHRSLSMSLDKPGTCDGMSALDAEFSKWTDRLPRDADDLWAWCLSQTRDTLLALLAVAAAPGIDAVREKSMREDAPRLLHAEALAAALRFDMRDWFTPTAANYFGRVSRARIMEALTEAGLPARTRVWSKLKKTELAALAEREIQGTGWLPQPLRRPADRAEPDTAPTDRQAAEVA